MIKTRDDEKENSFKWIIDSKTRNKKSILSISPKCVVFGAGYLDREEPFCQLNKPFEGKIKLKWTFKQTPKGTLNLIFRDKFEFAGTERNKEIKNEYSNFMNSSEDIEYDLKNCSLYENDLGLLSLHNSKFLKREDKKIVSEKTISPSNYNISENDIYKKGKVFFEIENKKDMKKLFIK